MCTGLLQLVFFSGKIPEVELLDCMVALFLIFFLKKLHMVFHSSCTSLCNGSFSSTSLPARVVCGLFGSSHSDRCEMIYHCGFDVHFPDD